MSVKEQVLEAKNQRIYEKIKTLFSGKLGVLNPHPLSVIGLARYGGGIEVIRGEESHTLIYKDLRVDWINRYFDPDEYHLEYKGDYVFKAVNHRFLRGYGVKMYRPDILGWIELLDELIEENKTAKKRAENHKLKKNWGKS